jgi:hypothetical protein
VTSMVNEVPEPVIRRAMNAARIALLSQSPADRTRSLLPAGRLSLAGSGLPFVAGVGLAVLRLAASNQFLVGATTRTDW